MRILPLALLVLLSVNCGQIQHAFEIEPNAELGPPKVTAEPPAGLFNGEITITLKADLDATIYVSSNGNDPRTTTLGRLSGPSPFSVTINATTQLQYFASVDGKDGELTEGLWTRAGGPKGTISGVIVVGNFAVGKQVGLSHNFNIDALGTPVAPSEMPFMLTNLVTGTYRLFAISDRNDDGQLVPFLDYQSATTSIDIDVEDPLKAGPENVRIYLAASSTGLGTLRGTITLPKPPPLQNLQISLLDPSALTGGLDPATLLTQLQNGYRIFTNQNDTVYPYVITDLMPGRVTPVPSLLGFASGGIALNLLANPLKQTVIVADEETIADFEFGPVTISGALALGSNSAPDGGLAFGVVAARAVTITEGIQAVLMPVIFTKDTMTNTSRANYSGTAFRANSTVTLRVFTNANGANPITDALGWVIGGSMPDSTVVTQMDDVINDISLP